MDCQGEDADLHLPPPPPHPMTEASQQIVVLVMLRFVVLEFVDAPWVMGQEKAAYGNAAAKPGC
jgi:hypothetical protein